MQICTSAMILAAMCGPAIADRSLQKLYHAHQWFALRDSVLNGEATPLYRAAVAYAFRDLGRARRELQEIVSRATTSEQALGARRLLVDVAQMNSDYRQALRRIREMQALSPGDRSLDNGAAFFSALKDYPNQKVVRRRRAVLRYSLSSGNVAIPLVVNGKSASYFFDTGANFSIVSESEARRVGLSVRDAAGSYSLDSVGAKVGVRVALARTISVGGFEIRNVVFLVVPDHQQPFIDLPVGSRGALGIPVALAFETVRWSADGEFEVAFDAPESARRDGNLCFDGANPLALGEYRGKPITFFLDTGAVKTRLTSLFAKTFPEDLAGAKRGVSTMRGVGGAVTVDTATIAEVLVRLGGTDRILNSGEVVLTQGETPNFHVWAGVDLFRRAQMVTIDFRSMRLVID